MTSSAISIMVNATGEPGETNASTSVSFGFTFRFSGYVKNETGGLQNNTNVSLYDFAEGVNGPPTETLVGNTLTDSDGAFTLTGLSSAGGKNYKLKMIYYNQSKLTQALKIGTTLPPFPSEMFYTRAEEGGESQFKFMKAPSLGSVRN